MDSRDQRALEHLRELGRRPAAPFFEQGPTAYIREVLAGLAGVVSRLDDFGNMIAHYANGADDSQPPIAFVAHMDHPGFEIFSEGTDERLYKARALGGVPVASLRKPMPVLVLTPDGRRVTGRTVPLPENEATQGSERRARTATPALVRA